MRITGRALRVWHPGMISIEEKNVYRMGNNQVGVLQGVPLTLEMTWTYWALGSKSGMNKKNGTIKRQDKTTRNLSENVSFLMYCPSIKSEHRESAPVVPYLACHQEYRFVTVAL